MAVSLTRKHERNSPGGFSDIQKTLRKKCPYSELFSSAFSSIRTRITPNTDTFQEVKSLNKMIINTIFNICSFSFFVSIDEYGSK